MPTAATFANTNFANQGIQEYMVWSRDFWAMARNLSFINQFAGKGSNSMVQRITELTKTDKGAKAVLTLIGDLTGDGVVGDYTLEGNEEEMKAYDTTIRIDQLRNANRLAGRLADQKTVVTFRENSRDQLAYWMADRIDQIAFLTLSGVAYTSTNKGGVRPVVGGGSTGRTLAELEYAADVTAPSTNRHLRWDATGGLTVSGGTNEVEATDTLTYEALVRTKAYAKDEYIRGIRSGSGEEIYHVFVTPQGMADLKLDPQFLANVRNAGVRGGKNPLFAGTTSVMVDGLVVHEYRHVFNNVDAASKWGAGSNVEGQRVLFCGAQALGFADIGLPEWVEDGFDYENQHGISIAKMFGFLKPVFHSNVQDGDEDFGVICLDTAIGAPPLS